VDISNGENNILDRSVFSFVFPTLSTALHGPFPPKFMTHLTSPYLGFPYGNRDKHYTINEILLHCKKLPSLFLIGRNEAQHRTWNQCKRQLLTYSKTTHPSHKNNTTSLFQQICFFGRKTQHNLEESWELIVNFNFITGRWTADLKDNPQVYQPTEIVSYLFCC